MTVYAPLPQRSLLRLSGEDTVPFLQGLITNDISRLDEGKAVYAALLSPQGKFLHDFFITRWQGVYWLDADAARMDDLRKRLTLYRLRSQVTIEPASPAYGVAACWDGAIASDHGVSSGNLCVVADPRLAVMGWRVIGDREAIAAWASAQGLSPVDEAAYDAWRLAHAVPDGTFDMIADKSLLLEFGFEQLGGVDFKKGCYVGQEVTARSKFRAQLRKMLYRVVAESGTLPAAGTVICCGEEQVGEMRSSAGGEGLALIRTEALENSRASGFPLRAGEVVVQVQPPPWMHP